MVEELFARKPLYRVARPVERSELDAASVPTFKVFTTVEEAPWARKPEESVARPEADSVELSVVAPRTPRVDPSVVAPETRSVDEAWSGAFATVRPFDAVELAVAMNPPEAFKVKSVVEAASSTMSGLPVWPESTLRERRFEAVVVAAMVCTDRTSGLEVPTPRLSVLVVRYTAVPASVQPAPEVMDAQTGFAPAPWVWRNCPDVPGASALTVPAAEK
jgi:hypothetical protein